MQVRKRFGQHFLHDPGIIRRIVDAVAPVAGERLVEVGPGRGALTWGLLARAQNMDVIEIDRDLARSLNADSRADPHLRVHVENVLDTDFIALRGDGAPLRIVGNLPYNISTPLLFRLLQQRAAIGDMHFMLQKEVVDRMAAAYMLRLRPTLEPRFDIGDDGTLRMLVTAAFSHRRKTLRNGLRTLLTGEEIEACGIDPKARPETLAPAQFGLLAAHYCRLRSAGALQSV